MDPGREVLIDDEGACTNRVLLERCNQVSHALHAHGVNRGDVVAAVLANHRSFLELALGTLQSGAYFGPISPRGKTDEILSAIRGLSPALLVVAASVFERLRDHLGSLDLDRRTFVVGGTGDVSPASSYSQFVGSQPTVAPVGRVAGQIVFQTGGTTGVPKPVLRPLPVMDPDSNGAAQALTMRYFDIDSGGVHLVAGPLYHAGPLGLALAALHDNQALVVMGQWDAHAALNKIATHRITSTFMVPAMFRSLLAVDDVTRHSCDVSSLQSVVHSAAPCPLEVKEQLLQWWGEIVHEYYGTVEGAVTYVSPPEWRMRRGTVGRPFPSVSVRIHLESGVGDSNISAGVGEVIFSHEGFRYVLDGRREAPPEIEHGYVTAGDVGYIDEDGWLFLVSRREEIVVVGGSNVYAPEIERLLATHPAVADVAVLGLEHRRLGERVHALIVPDERFNVAAVNKELNELCRRRLSLHKRPATFTFVKELPREPTGKLRRRELRQLILRQKG